jgi:hypothetical protein
MGTKTIQLGTSRNFTGFLGFRDVDLTSSYTITNADTNVTGALNGSTSRPVRLSTVEVFFRGGTAGTAAIIAGPEVRATSFRGSSVSTVNQSSLSASPNLAFFAGNEMWSGFRSTDIGTKRFWRGTQSGSNFRYNGSINTAFTSSNGTAINQTLTIHTAPSAPTSISASAGRNSVTLGWGAPSDNGGLGIGGYRVAYRTSGGTWAFFSTYAASATSATVTGLSSNTTYEFAVAATNGATDAHNSSYTSTSAHTGTNATISATTLEPLSPSLGTLTVTATNQTTIRVQWSTTNNPTSVSVSGPGMTTRNTASGDINATGLTANTTYTYTLETQNEANAGVPDSVTASARTLLPAPTLTITATTLTSTTARVVWSTTNATAASITGPNLTSTALSGNVIVEGLTRNTVYRWNGNSSNGDGNTGNVLSNQIQTLNVIGGVWTGTTFAVPAVRVWTGSTWAVKEAKVWTGTTWKVWV